MDITANPLLSLLGAAPATDTSAAPIASSGGSAAMGFAMLVTNQAQSNDGLSVDVAKPGQLLTGKLPELLGKLERIIEKVTTLLSDESDATVTIDDIAPALVELTDVIGELSEATNGAFLGGLTESVPNAMAQQISGNIESVAAKIVDFSASNILQITDVEPLSPENLAHAVIEIATAIQSEINTVVKALPETVANIATKFMAAGNSVVSTQKPANSPQKPATGETLGAVPEFSTAPVLEQSSAGPVVKPMSSQDQELILPQWATQSIGQATPKLSEAAQSVFSAIGNALENGAAPKVSVETSLGQILELPRELLPIIPQDIAATARDAIQSVEATQSTSAARAAESQAPRFSQAVVSQVRAVDFQEGTTKVELTPRGLGSVEIEMKTNSDGSLSVVVRAENAHVLSSLREERDLLALAVSDAGQGTFEFQEFNKDEQSQDQGGQGFSGGTGSESIADSADVTSDTAKIGGGQLDLMT
ncbi:MAG: flagellar hook-length control protein FliK [Cognatishimia sp.]